MPSIADLPVELLTDRILPLLPLSTLLQSVATTCRFFHLLTVDEALWKRKLEEDYSDTLKCIKATNVKRSLLYRRLYSPKIYVWGCGVEFSPCETPNIPAACSQGINTEVDDTSQRFSVQMSQGKCQPFPVRLCIPGARISSLVAGET